MNFDNFRIEKRGNLFYLIDEFGDELEMTAEQVKAQYQGANFLSKQFAALADMAKVNKWSIGTLPDDVIGYANIKAFFDIQKEQFEKLYKVEDDKELLVKTFMKSCDIAISKLKFDNANPYLKSELTISKIEGWKDFKSFISLFTLGKEQKKFKPSAASLRVLTQTSAPSKQEKAQFEENLKECRLSLEEIHDKALQAANTEMDIFKMRLEHELNSYPHRSIEILTKVKDALGYDYKRYRFREDDTKESLLEALTKAYGNTQDGKGVYDYLFRGYFIRLRQEYFKLSNQKSTTQERQTKEDNSKPSQARYALFYYYLHETGYEEHFVKHKDGKLAAMKEIADTLEISAKNFQINYNLIEKDINRKAVNQYDNIKAVIPMLKDYPKAQELAKDELNLIGLMK